jgi:hypothetical protein
MSAKDAALRRQIATIAAYSKHAKTDGRDATAAARRASHVTRFEDIVDPERILSPSERHRRVVAARKAYFRSLALKSGAARRARRGMTA